MAEAVHFVEMNPERAKASVGKVLAIKDAESVLKSENKAELDAKAQSLGQAAQKLGEKMYADQQKAAAGAAAGGESSPGQEQPKKDENVVDAEFTEVKDKKTG